MGNLEQKITEILERNRKVEADKAWETSLTRRLFIALFTYLCAWAWLILIGQRLAWLTAAVPVLGYLLSTLTLPPLKAWWLKRKQ
ncbi:MAG: hypothetical protein M1400_02260 [Patescibacteria group bacterium]|nr:hypothetical protein [Patescibacteria group bacterium]